MKHETDTRPAGRRRGGAPAVVIAGGEEAPRLFGLRPAEHVRRMLAGLGAGPRCEPDDDPPAGADSVLFWNGGAVCGKATLRRLLEEGDFLLTDESGNRLAARVPVAQWASGLAWLRDGGAAPPGVPERTVAGLGGIYDWALRKRGPALCEIVTSQNRADLEKRIYLSTYKGVTDLVTKYVWPAPALVLTRLFLALGLRPNSVTLAGTGFMLAALWLFWHGSFGWGLLAGWIMALLDTVDGKMARVSHTSSAVGNVLDHGMDLVHPPFWYLAWAVGLASSGTPLPDGWYGPLVGWIFATYIAARLFEGWFIRRFGFHIHVWRRFDSAFRLVVARRNPNLILLTAGWAAGRPDAGLIAVLAWQVVAVVVHLGQTLVAEAASRREPLRSWLEIQAASEAAGAAASGARSS